MGKEVKRSLYIPANVQKGIWDHYGTEPREWKKLDRERLEGKVSVQQRIKSPRGNKIQTQEQKMQEERVRKRE